MDDDEKVNDAPLVELTVTVWRSEEGLLTAITRMGDHEVGRTQGTDLHDVLVAAGRTLAVA